MESQSSTNMYKEMSTCNSQKSDTSNMQVSHSESFVNKDFNRHFKAKYSLKELKIYLRDIKKTGLKNGNILSTKQTCTTDRSLQNPEAVVNGPPYPLKLYHTGHHEAPKYVCSHCGQLFRTVFDLQLHRLSHMRHRGRAVCSDLFSTLSSVDSDAFCEDGNLYVSVSQESAETAQEVKLRCLSESTLMVINRIVKQPEFDIKPNAKCDPKLRILLGVENVDTHDKDTVTFYCKACEKEVKDLEDFTEHDTTTKSPLFCQLCQNYFPSVCAFYKHQKRHRKYHETICEKCSCVTENLEELEKHKQLHDEEYFRSLLIISDIDAEATNKFSLVQKRVPEPESEIISIHKQNLQQNTDIINIEINNTKPEDDISLPKHCDIHNDTHDKVEEGSSGNETLEMKVDHVYSCSLCDKDFPSAFALSVHFRLHTGEKPYKCEECERSFLQQKTYLIHKKTHIIRPEPASQVSPNSMSQSSQTTRQPTSIVVHRPLETSSGKPIGETNENGILTNTKEYHSRRFVPFSHHSSLGGFVSKRTLKQNHVNNQVKLLVCPVCKRPHRSMEAKKKCVRSHWQRSSFSSPGLHAQVLRRLRRGKLNS